MGADRLREVVAHGGSTVNKISTKRGRELGNGSFYLPYKLFKLNDLLFWF